MRILMASAAAFALATTPAVAQPGKDKGNGNGNGKPAAAAKADRGNGPSMRGSQQRGNGNGNGAAKSDRGSPNLRSPVANANRGETQGRNAAAKDRGNGNGNDGRRIIERRAATQIDRRGERGSDYRVTRRYGERDWRDDVRFERADFRNFYTYDRNPGLINGCPPGLAKKRNGCNPPGQVKDRYSYSRPDWWGLTSILGGNYRYRDGYLVDYGPSGIARYLPLLGGALSVGNVWPNNYEARAVPNYYVDYYDLGSASNYRYADDTLYRIDGDTAAITSIAALLTGDEFVVGQPMPRGYDVYNVPYGYRDQYYDRPDAYYRYSDGYIYQVDPETRLIAAAIELLV